MKEPTAKELREYLAHGHGYSRDYETYKMSDSDRVFFEEIDRWIEKQKTSQAPSLEKQYKDLLEVNDKITFERNALLDRVQDLHLELISTLGQFEDHVHRSHLVKCVKEFHEGLITRNELANFMIKFSGWEPPEGWVTIGTLLPDQPEKEKELVECARCAGSGMILGGMDFHKKCSSCDGAGFVFE